MFYFEEINNKKILKSNLLNGLNHCFTTRETMIKSKESNDEETIKNNKTLICKHFNISEKNLICPEQTHSTNISTANQYQTDYPATDAMILTNPTQAVYLNFADCTPIILYDEKQNIGAIAHAGWRGTAGEIAPKTVEQMCLQFGSHPENIKAVIGPAIGQCCYCVGEDVAQKLAQTILDANGCIQQKNTNIFVDLKEINHRQLLACGVQKIDICDYCTSCANELFFSYRKENGTTRRHSAIIKLQER